MTVNGATGDTEKQMRTVLHTASMSSDEANKQWASLLTGLDGRSSDQTLATANALFARKGIAFKKPFIDADRDFFGAEITTLDFQKDDVAGAINGWVSKNTRGMITQIVDQVPPAAILYLANAVYFKGEWVSPFKHESTQKSSFTRADGSKTEVDMMNATEQMPYVENAIMRAARLTYKGKDTAFYVMLPNQGVSLDAAMSSLQGTGFSELRRAMTSKGTTEVILGLPKLDSDFSTELSKPLAEMGMPRAFDVERAEFSNMATLDVPIYISRVLHKTKVKVDEKGTEAAAATVVEMTMGASARSGEPPRIICDRPYLFSIVDEKSGTMLFLGAVNDPKK
jgi:serpin B